MAQETLPVVTGEKDRSLQEALTRLTASRGPVSDPADPIVTAAHRLPAIAASFAPYPEGTDPRLRSALAARGVEQLYTHQAEAFGHVARRPQRRHHHADRFGQDALLQRAGAERDPAGSVDPRAVSVSRPRRWRRISSPSCTRCRSSSASDTDVEIGVFTYDGDTPSDARRAIRGKAHVVLSNPDMLHSGILPHHPRWAKLFENLRFVVIDELHAYRGVFGSHLAQHPAPAAADLPALRVRSGLHLLVGDDRQSARAGRGADRAPVRAGREERRAARREVLPLRQPAGRQRAARHPPLVPGRGAAGRARVPEAQPAADPLRAEPAGGRDPDDVSEGCLPRPAGRGRRHPRLSRRLPAEPPPRDRARAARRAGARGGLDQRARARHRHRRARRVGDGRLPGNDCRDLAARRPRRAPRRRDRRRCWCASSAPIDQFIVRNPSYFFDAIARARADQSRQPAHPARPREVRGVRAAVHETTRQFGVARRRDEVDIQAVLGVLAEEGFVHQADGQWNWTNESYPADAVSLRSVSSDNFVDRRHHARRAGHRRDRLHQRPVDAAREGDLHRRRALFQVERLDFDGRKAYVRAVDCDYYTDAITYTKVTILDTFETGRQLAASSSQLTADDDELPAPSSQLPADDAELPALGSSSFSGTPRRSRAGGRIRPRRDPLARRGPRRLARRRLQEDQVLHQRERRLGRARSARAADAHLVVLADDSVGGDGGAAVCRRRSPRRRRRPGVRDEERRAAAADVRRPRHRPVGGRRRARAVGADRRHRRRARRARDRAERLHLRQLSRAASASAGRCSRCTRRCWRGRAS